MKRQTQTMLERYRGALLGLACGDALGTTVEFCPRGSFAPLIDIVGGGPFELPAGAWTDDTSMALCLAHSLLHCQGFDARDQMNRYCNWAHYGYMSSTGNCFDIGATVHRALDHYLHTGNPFAGSSDPNTAGNGSLMRLAPLPMFYSSAAHDLSSLAADSARTTHGAAEAIECTQLFAHQIYAALHGADKARICLHQNLHLQQENVAALQRGEWRDKGELLIRGSGYAVQALEAALWCFWHSNSYSEAVLRAANLGEDADTTAAITGQLAGAFYGYSAIPEIWRQRLVMHDHLVEVADALYQQRV